MTLLDWIYKLEPKDLISIISITSVALCSILGHIVQLLGQKRQLLISRAAQLHASKSNSYATFLKDADRYLMTLEESEFNAMLGSYQLARLFAPPEVATELRDFVLYTSEVRSKNYQDLDVRKNAYELEQTKLIVVRAIMAHDVSTAWSEKLPKRELSKMLEQLQQPRKGDCKK